MDTGAHHIYARLRASPFPPAEAASAAFDATSLTGRRGRTRRRLFHLEREGMSRLAGYVRALGAHESWAASPTPSSILASLID
jgi:hypothetical protein